MTEKSELGIFGGTFDPIHYGHIKPVQEAAKKLSIAKVYLLPNQQPVHKPNASADSDQRLAMLRLVCAEYPMFSLDTRELERPEKSYSLLTLQELVAQHPGRRIYFFIGMDSLNTLPDWYQSERLFDYCHFVVTRRPGHPLAPAVQSKFAHRIIETPQQPPKNETGNILIFDTNQVDVSSTRIRQYLRQQCSIEQLMPAAVAAYINAEKLYQ
ncbi:nicotinate-nucleotide adenylyltransferase [Thalassotalea mangrovi]|uniref:Probable nicotinate-nucleotide adenylyltransferase n=1 Tax=Thalassotalea mangrovi TaxID=2572245 RepID=A0A4V5NTX4_9GAMM|nr:nicotinate-nucleotide adenylyltransferase [Thalassotalea mangrovi]TKB43443.1 nicotinate-nucleotide adenylyltransferase [Thalassotalea mangrovi]